MNWLKVLLYTIAWSLLQIASTAAITYVFGVPDFAEIEPSSWFYAYYSSYLIITVGVFAHLSQKQSYRVYSHVVAVYAFSQMLGLGSTYLVFDSLLLSPYWIFEILLSIVAVALGVLFGTKALPSKVTEANLGS